MTKEIERITEETANNLANALNKLDKAFEQCNESMVHYTTAMINKISMTLMDKASNAVLHSQKKLEKATFLTRWYWQRRAKKDMAKLAETTEAIQNFKYLDNEQH